MLTCGNTVLDTETRTLATATGSVRITPQQCGLAAKLFAKPGVVSKDTLLAIIWGDRNDGPYDAIVNTQISYLRAAFRHAGSDVRIIADGEGYRLVAPETPLEVRAYSPRQVEALCRIMEYARTRTCLAYEVATLERTP